MAILFFQFDQTPRLALLFLPMFITTPCHFFLQNISLSQQLLNSPITTTLVQITVNPTRTTARAANRPPFPLKPIKSIFNTATRVILLPKPSNSMHLTLHERQSRCSALQASYLLSEPLSLYVPLILLPSAAAPSLLFIWRARCGPDIACLHSFSLCYKCCRPDPQDRLSDFDHVFDQSSPSHRGYFWPAYPKLHSYTQISLAFLCLSFLFNTDGFLTYHTF